MFRTAVLLTLVVGAVVVLASESTDRQRLVARGTAMVGTAVQHVRAAGAAVVQHARGAVADGVPEALRGLRDQGVVTDDFIARRGSATRQAPASAPAAIERDAAGWSHAEYEGTKRRLFDALRRLEGSVHED